ncbi:MAG: deoxyribose-phosphate aldolase [Nitrososphaeria archaeon]
MSLFSWNEIARHIDHTILKPTTTSKDVTSLCNEAIEMGVYCVAIPPTYVKLAKNIVGNAVKVACGVSFPMGYTPPEVKAFEVEHYINEGADEVDFVVNQGFIKEGCWEDFDRDVSAVVDKASKYDVVTKAIIEVCNLTDQEKVSAVNRLNVLGVDYVKTSTGFGASGATLNDVVLLKTYCKGKLKVKAAGGIRTLSQVVDFLKVGVDRIGTSSTRAIREEYLRTSLHP